MSEAYQAQLEVVAMQPGYDDWPWREVVELQRKEPSRLLNKYLSYGDEEYAQSYATMSSGCECAMVVKNQIIRPFLPLCFHQS